LFGQTINGSIVYPGIFNIYSLIVAPGQMVSFQVIWYSGPYPGVWVGFYNSTCKREYVINGYNLLDSNVKFATLTQGGEYVIHIGTSNSMWLGDYRFVLNMVSQPTGKIPKIAVCKKVDGCGTVPCNSTTSNTLIPNNTNITLTEPVIYVVENMTIPQGSTIILQGTAIIEAKSIILEQDATITIEDGAINVTNFMVVQSGSFVNINVDIEPMDNYINVGGCANISSGATLKISGSYSDRRTLLKASCLGGQFSSISLDQPDDCKIRKVDAFTNPPSLIMFTNLNPDCNGGMLMKQLLSGACLLIIGLVLLF